jgi:two-component system nitrate/nitrite sensor histidine kinase NarX
VPLAPDAQLQIMHILHEALANVRKHAGATAVEIAVERGPGHRFVVRDNGRGFDPERRQADAADHVGLRIMRERAARIGATLEIRSQPRRGTEIVLAVPVAQREAAQAA